MTDAHTTHATHPTRLLLVTGGLLLVVGNLAHPLDADPGPLSRFAFASEPEWLPIHLTVAIGFLLLTAGLASLGRRLDRAGAGAWSTVGTTAALMGGTLLFAVFGALDGYAVAALATSDAGPATVAAAAVAEDAIDSGLAGLGTLAFFGLGIGATSAAMARAGIGRRWLVWTGAAVGLLGTAAGVVLLGQGPTPLAINVLLRPAAAAGTLWLVVLGLVSARLGPTEPAVTATDPARRDVARPAPPATRRP